MHGFFFFGYNIMSTDASIVSKTVVPKAVVPKAVVPKAAPKSINKTSIPLLILIIILLIPTVFLMPLWVYLGCGPSWCTARTARDISSNVI